MKGKSSRKARKPSTFKLQFCTADFYVEKSDGGYDVIKIKGGSLTTQIGWPELPITTKHFVLPTHATKITLKVEKQKWVRLPGRFSLAPAQLPRPAIKNPPPGDDRLIHFRQGPNFRPKNGRPGRLPLPPIPAWGGLEYQANEVFVPLAPDAAKAELISYPTAEIASISQVGGRPVVSVLFHPLRYRPRTGIVEVLSQAQLQISHSYDQAGIIDGQLSEAALAQDMQKLISLVENPGDIKFEFPNLEGLEDLPPFCPDEPGFEPEFPKRFPKKYPVIIDDRIFIPPDVLFIPREQDWPYLIITDDYEWNENGTKGSHI